MSVSNDAVVLDSEVRNRKIEIVKQLLSQTRQLNLLHQIDYQHIISSDELLITTVRFGKGEIVKQLISQGVGTVYRDLVS